jgi:hypothetical protein
MLGLPLPVLFERRFQGAAADVTTLRDSGQSIEGPYRLAMQAQR